MFILFQEDTQPFVSDLVGNVIGKRRVTSLPSATESTAARTVLTMSLGVNCTVLGTDEFFGGGKLQES